MKTAIYVRVSTDSQDTQLQIKELESLCQLRGFQVYHIYEDKGFTGRNIKRPALQKLLEDVRLKKLDMVVVWKFDRFARSLKELIFLLDDLTKHGVKFISLKDSVDMSTPQGVFMMHILGAFAEFESDMIRMRVKSGMRHAKLNGTRSGKPIGKVKVRDDKQIRFLHKQGFSYGQIAKNQNISKTTVSRSIKSDKLGACTNIKQ